MESGRRQARRAKWGCVWRLAVVDERESTNVEKSFLFLLLGLFADFSVTSRWKGRGDTGACSACCCVEREASSRARPPEAAERRRERKSFDASARCLKLVFLTVFFFFYFSLGRRRWRLTTHLQFRSRVCNTPASLSFIGNAGPCPPQRSSAAPQRGKIERNGELRERERDRRRHPNR